MVNKQLKRNRDDTEKEQGSPTHATVLRDLPPLDTAAAEHGLYLDGLTVPHGDVVKEGLPCPIVPPDAL